MANLAEKVTVNHLARQFDVSKYHLHRVFFAHTGFDLAEYIVRRKMEQAVAMLKSGNAVIDIALALGYESHSAFSRSFKQIYSVSPSNADVGALQNTIILHTKKVKESDIAINFDIEKRETTTLHGLYVSINDASLLPQVAHQTFSQLVDNSAIRQALTPIGVAMSNPWVQGADDTTFFFGYASSPHSASSVEAKFIWPAQHYATTIYTGPYNQLWQFISRCHAEIVRRKQVCLSNRRIVQCYLNSPEDTPSERLKTQLYFPVQN